ncbi:stage III sporulation protein AF [Thalassobacillus pellis]|uniref:stage III sporulation protein AF n=1 Tax=Thalassobacillus pellis TaxID=748008 RepID=UPI001961AC8E|nr:stage III sporulation protein AF [Thalassobacillus pellis]MBM7552331.1 stage III sporulation protein AF [Thalassobacillus pellis]
MSYVIQWVTEIVIFLLLAMVIDFLLPSGQMQKYARLTISLILLLLFLNPVFELFNTDINQLISRQSEVFSQQQMTEEDMKKSIEMKKNEIEASQDAYILEQMVVQMKAQAADQLADEYQAALTDLELTFVKGEKDIDKLETVLVTLSEERTVDSIDRVEINLDAPVKKEDNQADEAIIEYLAKLWQVEKEQIQIQWEGEHG